MDLDRHTNIYITNMVKCRPPQNRDPQPQEQEACLPWLREPIRPAAAEILVCLGRIAAMKLIKPDIKITREHGVFFEKGRHFDDGHPPPRRPAAQPRAEPAAFEDYLKLREKIDKLGCDIAKQG